MESYSKQVQDEAESNELEGEYWDVENWYHALQDVTFPTVFIPMSMKTVDALIHAHEKDYQEGEQELLEKLEADITSKIEAFSSKSAFVRISTLSPKDATKVQIQKLKSALQAELSSVAEGDRQGEIIALNKCLGLLCKVRNGKEAMALLVASDRVYGHLARRRREVGGFRMSIVIREWVNFRPELEFRGFVYQHKLTAVTHYYKFCFVEDIRKNKDKIEVQLKEFFAKHVKHRVTPSNYVCDFAIMDNGTVAVVELNPFGESTSSGLFDWKTDLPLLKGETPFQLRILETADPNVRERLGPALRFILDDLRPLPPQNEKHASSRTCTVM